MFTYAGLNNSDAASAQLPLTDNLDYEIASVLTVSTQRNLTLTLCSRRSEGILSQPSIVVKSWLGTACTNKGS